MRNSSRVRRVRRRKISHAKQAISKMYTQVRPLCSLSGRHSCTLPRLTGECHMIVNGYRICSSPSGFRKSTAAEAANIQGNQRRDHGWLEFAAKPGIRMLITSTKQVTANTPKPSQKEP